MKCKNVQSVKYLLHKLENLILISKSRYDARHSSAHLQISHSVAGRPLEALWPVSLAYGVKSQAL